MTRQKTKKPRTYARNRQNSEFTRTGREKQFETDGAYLLKLVIVLICGTVWLKFDNPAYLGAVPLLGVPIGLIIGIFLVSRLERLQANRKIWYAMLLLSTVVSLFLPAGIVI